MIDPGLPLELDDSTPVTLVKFSKTLVRVYLPAGKAPTIDQESAYPQGHAWYYRLSDGVFSGSSKEKMFVVRNVEMDTGPEDWRLPKT